MEGSGDWSMLSVALSAIFSGAICFAASAAIAYCFPSKDMLDAEAVDQEWTTRDA